MNEEQAQNLLADLTVMLEQEGLGFLVEQAQTLVSECVDIGGPDDRFPSEEMLWPLLGRLPRAEQAGDAGAPSPALTRAAVLLDLIEGYMVSSVEMETVVRAELRRLGKQRLIVGGPSDSEAWPGGGPSRVWSVADDIAPEREAALAEVVSVVEQCRSQASLHRGPWVPHPPAAGAGGANP